MLDLSRVLAGPFVGRMLADLGADVVKVEPPEGDLTRNFGQLRGRQTGYYTQWNAGKRNISIDLRADGGPELVRRLAAEADIVVENFRPGVLAAYGLDWASLSAEKPDLVMLSISGFGQDGPESQRAAYAGIVHAESGWLARHAQAVDQPVRDSPLSVGDTFAGLHGLVGLLAALRVKEQTGIGQHVDIAMIDTILATDDYQHWSFDGIPMVNGGGEIWDTVGGPIIVMGDFRWVWKCATRILGLSDPTPEGASLETKIEMRRQAWADHLASFDSEAEVLAELDRANLAWGRVKQGPGVHDSPTLAHRNSLVDVDDRAGGSRRIVQSPYRFSSNESGVAGPAPHQGEHNAEVLGEWLSMSSAEVDALAEGGVLIDEETLG